MTNRFFAASALSLACALSANAAPQKLSYEQVKEACRKPESFHNQIKPANMEIHCADSQSRWIPIGNGTYTLPRGRKVTVGLSSDKYELPAAGKDVAIQQQSGECPKFKEQIERIQTTRATSCEEILAFQGTEVQFCTGVLDELRQSNPGAIQFSDSGRVVHFCAPAMPAPPAPPVPPKQPQPLPPKQPVAPRR